VEITIDCGVVAVQGDLDVSNLGNKDVIQKNGAG
jgi:hypothetical protein